MKRTGSIEFEEFDSPRVLARGKLVAIGGLRAVLSRSLAVRISLQHNACMDTNIRIRQLAFTVLPHAHHSLTGLRFVLLCMQLYSAHNVVTMSFCVMTSLDKRSRFDALYNTRGAKIAISVDYKSK